MKQLAKTILRTFTRSWPSHSRLIPVGEAMGWSVDKDIQELTNIWGKCGVRCLGPKFFELCSNQSVFLGSQFGILDNRFLNSDHRLGIAYFHGIPGQGNEEMDRLFQRFVKVKDRFIKIQVSHQRMYDLLYDHGFSNEQLELIPIGINPSYFEKRTRASYKSIREQLSIPSNAFVVGSFQKDGVGWGEGNEPKLIKGPDIFLEVMKLLKNKIPNLHILLSGPSRGYVKNGLSELDIPFTHRFLEDATKIGLLFGAIDLYVIASRDEGGPKAVLESMISEVPLVSTSVGQAVDIINNGVNGYLSTTGEVAELAEMCYELYSDQAKAISFAEHGYRVAFEHTYQSQVELWRSFMNGFVKVD